MTFALLDWLFLGTFEPVDQGIQGKDVTDIYNLLRKVEGTDCSQSFPV